MTDVGGIAADALYHHGIPWLAKKTFEMGRYGASELMRDKKLQKKAVDYGMKKLSPLVVDTAGKALDQLSTKVRPHKKYVTEKIWMEVELIFINGYQNCHDQKRVGRQEITSIWELIILLINNLNTILKLVKF